MKPGQRETLIFLICAVVVVYGAYLLMAPSTTAQPKPVPVQTQKLPEPKKAIPKALVQLGPVELTWEHLPVDLAHLDKFKVFAGPTKETAAEIKELKYEGQSPLATTITLSISGNPGDVVRYYFAVQSISKLGNPTNRVFGKTVSGTEYLEFLIPKDVSDPFNVIIKIVVQ